MDVARITSLIEQILYSEVFQLNKDRDMFDVATLGLSLISAVVAGIGVLITYWLVTVVQNGINDRRLLKDHFIREVLEIRGEYFDLFQSLQEGKHKAKQIQFLFQQISIRVEDLMPSLYDEFVLVKDDLTAYHLTVLNGVAELEEYKRKYSRNTRVFTTIRSRDSLQLIQRESIGTFNSLVRQINNST